MTFHFHCTWHLHTCTFMTGANIHCKTFKILHKYMKHTGIYSTVYLFHSFQIKQTSDLFNRQIRKSFQSICSCVDIHFLYHQIKKTTRRNVKHDQWFQNAFRLLKIMLLLKVFWVLFLLFYRKKCLIKDSIEKKVMGHSTTLYKNYIVILNIIFNQGRFLLSVAVWKHIVKLNIYASSVDSHLNML